MIFFMVFERKNKIVLKKKSWFFDEKNDLFMNSNGQEKHQKNDCFKILMCFYDLKKRWNSYLEIFFFEWNFLMFYEKFMFFNENCLISYDFENVLICFESAGVKKNHQMKKNDILWKCNDFRNFEDLFRDFCDFWSCFHDFLMRILCILIWYDKIFMVTFNDFC